MKIIIIIQWSGSEGDISCLVGQLWSFDGKVFVAASELYTYGDTVKAMSRISGMMIEEKQMAENPFGYLPPARANIFKGIT